MGKDQESAEVKKASQIEEELQAFVPVPEYITSLTGEQIEVPKTSWKAEIQIGRLIGTAVSAVPQLSNIDFKNLKITDLVALLPAIMKGAPDAITGIVVLLVKKDKEWVEENLNSESIMGLLGPFFGNFLKRLLKNVNLEQLEALKIPLPRAVKTSVAEVVAFFVTECKVWPPDEVFSASPEELRLLGAAIARKKGMEQEFQAMIHGAKLKSKPQASDARSLDQQLLEGKAKGLPIEIRGKG